MAGARGRSLCFPVTWPTTARSKRCSPPWASTGTAWTSSSTPSDSLQAIRLDGDFTAVTTREGFRIAHDISAYSFIALAKAGREMMKGRNGSLLTLSYLGAERTMPNYNVMGLAKASLEAGVRYLAGSLGAEGTRVNAVSAGPIRTLAASGIKSFRKMLAANERQTPLRRNVTIEEVGNAGAFLCSDLASGISGEILYVDGGFNTTAMGPLDDD